MRKVIYKYNVGDVVKFKECFHPTASCGLKNLAGTTARITAQVDYGGATYKLEGHIGVFKEACFAGLATEPVFDSYDDNSIEADIELGKCRMCRIGLSGGLVERENESHEVDGKWYRISFSAKLSPDDIRAMKKYFFDTMNESMEIYDLAELKIEEA